jgi:hypothetical protein
VLAREAVDLLARTDALAERAEALRALAEASGDARYASEAEAFAAQKQIGCYLA